MAKSSGIKNNFSYFHKNFEYKNPELDQYISAFEHEIKECLHTNLTLEKMEKCFLAIDTRRKHPRQKEDPYNQNHRDDAEYTKIVDAAIQARNSICTCHIRLVYYIAKHFQNFGLPLWDLINAGSLWAMKAVERYNGNHQTFVGYLTNYITWHILGALKEQKNYSSRIKSMDSSRGLYDNDVHAVAGREDGASFEITGYGLIPDHDHWPDHTILIEDMRKDIMRVIDILPTALAKILVLNYWLKIPRDFLSPHEQENCAYLHKENIAQDIFNTTWEDLLPGQQETCLYYYEQDIPKYLSVEQLSQMYDMTPQTIRNRKNKGEAKLRMYSRRLLLKYLFTDEKWLTMRKVLADEEII